MPPLLKEEHMLIGTNNAHGILANNAHGHMVYWLIMHMVYWLIITNNAHGIFL